MIQLLRGFKDILPGEIELWQEIENTARLIFEDFGFKEIRIPILEKTELFLRSIGEDTDIVEKEMYTFADRKGDLVTLRPEATASVVRAYIQHKLYAADPIQKLYTIGPMFRRERPQKGRYRQFYQINAEVYGISSPFIDAQLIFMLMTLLSRLGVNDICANINSLGCKACRPNFNEALCQFLSKINSNLCEDCNRRRGKNPLRVLDCKIPECKEALKSAPSIANFLCNDCISHFEIVKEALTNLNISFLINKNLVRGLDYYTQTTFEIQTNLLGAQNAVAGGGRYDGLVSALGGPNEPAIGFAIGLDRLVEILSLKKEDLTKKVKIFIAPLGENAQKKAFEWTCSLNSQGVKTEMDFSGKNLKAMMKRADRLGAFYVLMIGDKEIEDKQVTLRNMATKEQVFLLMDNIVEQLKNY